MVANPKDVEMATDQELVDWGLDIEEGLTEWEMNFLEDMRRVLKSGVNLTRGRRLKLEEIITEKG